MFGDNYSWKETEKRIHILRGAVFLSLVCSTFIFGGLTFHVYYTNEAELLHTHYQSIYEQFNRDVNHILMLEMSTYVSLGIFAKNQVIKAE